MSKETGGPVMPSEYSLEENQGITLRDYFAAKAMQGFAASPSMIDSNDSRAISYVADASYAMADAMLAARNA
ncbi:hypothetical protein M2401_000846 [Pseudomonas sp. JUb42]|uniref:hypothetical protein n=1 Tax=Pseudomonas sp. JUb42 TaxID=2940611 RepID=UPI002166C42C|nr:hypothetical protein [Pseudomonas sp. JUb42]MCS3467125.1 hypothetical protein [Pseudomonas sp. JUb42]